jgi:hypothetical protein
MSHPSLAIGQPEPSEYASYYGRYISLVTGCDPLTALSRQIDETCDLLRTIPEKRSEYRYAPEKWSIKEVVGHMSDTERVMTYRALRFARADKTELPGFEQDDFVKAAGSDHLPFADLIDEFAQMRRSTLCLFHNFQNEAWSRVGIASGNPVSVRALAYIVAGHELHHMKVLREKYLA